MFKFNFGEQDSENGTHNQANTKTLEWVTACEINPLTDCDIKCTKDDYIEKEIFPNITVKLMKYDVVINQLKSENCNYVIEAESHHSDLLPSKYEGGLKIWECTYDLANYILQENLILENKKILDLGCGAGIVGLLAVLNGATVHFQDYNAEVIKYITIPNVQINNEKDVLRRCKFYSGDWKSFTEMLNEQYPSEENKYDYIFTSETIYNPDNYTKLLQVFKSRLKKNGVGLIAGKTHYFGVGGGMRQFEEIINSDKSFYSNIVWNSSTGLTREILKITWRNLEETV